MESRQGKIRFLVVIVLALFFSETICAWSQEQGSRLEDPSSIPATDPSRVVADLLNGLASGQLDHRKIIYGKREQPLPVVHIPGRMFHTVRFKIEEIRVSKYDPKTQTVHYSCVVPHPAVAFWQWKPIDPAELKYVPKGIYMKGVLSLLKDQKTGWNVKVENATNPISLYNRVVWSTNRTWNTFMTSGKPSQELITFNVITLIAVYEIALNIPDKERKQFAEDIIGEFGKTVPWR